MMWYAPVVRVCSYTRTCNRRQRMPGAAANRAPRSRSTSIERGGLPPRPSPRPAHSRSSSVGSHHSRASSRHSSVDLSDSRGSVRNMLTSSTQRGRRRRRNTGSIERSVLTDLQNYNIQCYICQFCFLPVLVEDAVKWCHTNTNM